MALSIDGCQARTSAKASATTLSTAERTWKESQESYGSATPYLTSAPSTLDPQVTYPGVSEPVLSLPLKLGLWKLHCYDGRQPLSHKVTRKRLACKPRKNFSLKKVL